MNLIQQLQATPKWGEFEEWYNKQEDIITLHNPTCYCKGDCINGCIWLIDLPFMYQKGVFEKFIESQGFEIHFDGNYHLYCNQSYVLVNNKLPNWKSFEELLMWYFETNKTDEYARLMCDKQKEICAEYADLECTDVDVDKNTILNAPYPWTTT